ncbi:MAG: DNA-processing protein DprA, partial [Planctomycetes bacterium]|nr:DNA-processing protein DprA [Planctomycetota bacterium]
IHPRKNLRLAEHIAESGAVLSELKPNTPPSAQNLMARDRITSGLSLGVLVVEAAEESGSLDTAKRGERQGRLVLAVDWKGESDARRGNAQLLRHGAIPVPCAVSASVKEILGRLNTVTLSETPSEPADRRQGTLF